METRAHYVAVGVFVLAIVSLAFGAVLWLGRVEFSQVLERYYIFFQGIGRRSGQRAPRSSTTASRSAA